MSFLDRFRSPEGRERKAREGAEQEAARVRAEEAAQRQVFVDAVGVDLADAPMDTAADAKLAIKLARLRKKELQGVKRELAAELADVREAWRERQAGRFYTGGLGRRSMIRTVVQAKRRSERLDHAAEVNQYSDARQIIDEKILVVDRLIAQLERIVLDGGRSS